MTPLAIPTSLQASLLARLDRLAPTSDVAQIAAALGRQFSHELISAVAAMPRQQLDDALAQLVHAELIFRRGTPPDAEYTFKHALVQDAAYSTLLRSRRQQMHARIAATLEDQFPEIVVAQPALLARHCAEAGLAEKAVAYWLKAGQAGDRALGDDRSGRPVAEGAGRARPACQTDLGAGNKSWTCNSRLDRHWLPRKVFRRPRWARPSRERARWPSRLIDPSTSWRLFFGQWAFHLGRGEHKLALALAEQIEKIGEARNDVSGAMAWVAGQTGLPASISGTSLPPVHSWSGVMASLIRRIAASVRD